MPIPLLAGLIVGGLGLSAGKTVFAAQRKEKRIGLFDETLGNAERLDEGQRKLIRGVFSLDQQEGIDLLDQTLQRNLSREQLKQAAGFQVENVRDRLAGQALRQKEYDNKVRELDQATSPKVTATTLARQGLRVIGTPAEIAAGDFEVAPVRKTAKWGEALNSHRSIINSLDNANALVQSIADHGAIVDLNNPIGQQQAFHHQLMIAGMKTVLETGALAEFEAAMVQRAIADPGSFFNSLMGGGDDRALLGAAMFRDIVAKSGERSQRDKSEFQFDQKDYDEMSRALAFSLRNQPVIARPLAAGGPVLQPNQVRVSPGGSIGGQKLEELSLQAQILNANLGGNVQQSADLMSRLAALRRQGGEVGAGRAALPGILGSGIENIGESIGDLFR